MTTALLLLVDQQTPLWTVALVMAAGFLFDHPYALSSPAATSHVTPAEADQAERALDDLQLLRQFDAAVATPGAARSM